MSDRPATPLLDASLLEAPIVRRDAYHYFVHPLTDGIPRIDPDLFEEVGAALAGIMGPEPDLLVTAEAMGIPAALALGQRARLPLTVVRKRAYGLPGEHVLEADTGYGSSTLHFNAIDPGTRVTIVDDVVSTGGTMLVMIEALERIGAELLEVLVVLSRGDGLDRVREVTNVPVKVLRHIEVDPERQKVRLVEPEDATDVRT